MTFSRIRPAPIAGALGAEIAGVTLAEDLSDDIVAELRAALLEHLVLFFRGQDVTPEQHLAFAKRFGDLMAYPMVSDLDDHPDIVPVVKREGAVLAKDVFVSNSPMSLIG